MSPPNIARIERFILVHSPIFYLVLRLSDVRSSITEGRLQKLLPVRICQYVSCLDGVQKYRLNGVGSIAAVTCILHKRPLNTAKTQATLPISCLTTHRSKLSDIAPVLHAVPRNFLGRLVAVIQRFLQTLAG